jgi:flagellar motility protein MotE (MotC chaperone)
MMKSAKLELARLSQQIAALTTSERDTRFKNEELQAIEKSLRSKVEQLLEHNNTLEQRKSEITKQLRLLETGKYISKSSSLLRCNALVV